ncbi:lipid-A-disaccharide synthase N-terminal domain-containing protein [Microbulbifer sp. THAF38]|uniref:lipid-A-disaccharide synthase N-terminal domain-containing protein n=1 Tax=Microbulbifer sp. THAF38 TaxID=2587856 RepID=UPI0012A9A85A|nr:lipid-A-disaccharide synthase N-terminal domain-containing protein [Microbulbifer sp. THAF38]QFT54818.1 lipid-A-disaccharide synthase [Microbulbifer sp. THAF38]
MSATLAEWWGQVQTIEKGWLVFGLGAQIIFFLRFVVQWIASERAHKSIVPEAFWYISLVGGAMMVIYGIHRADPVIIIGQFTGIFIYCRNIYLILRTKQQ